ncbi:MAG TPA: hypothetical protein VN722_02900 [Hanamia sp.]|nr:hypothetical protein [Hanamia sp.]
MEQNNFEKNVQHKLDELKIPPSDSVWTNIEKRIGKKDKDSKLVFILFFLILFLLTGGYFLFNSSKNNGQQKHELSEIKKDRKATNNDNSSLIKTSTAKNQTSRTPDFTNGSEEKIKTTSIKIQNKVEVPKKKLQVSIIETAERKQMIFLSNNGNQKKENENKLSIEASSNPIKGENEILIQKENIERTDSVLDKKEIAKDSSENNIQAIAKKGPKKSIEKKKDHWRFGITLSGGTSMISKNFFHNFVYAVPTTAYYGGIPSSYYYAPSDIRNSTGFVAGIFAEKNISAKKKISIGISYKYFSLLNKVGNRIDSLYSLPQSFTSLNNVYSSAINLKTYRNNFHFIEVPLSIKFQLNNNSDLPIFWNAGINISQLISTNALQFNSSAGLYYQDNLFFNKTQFGLSTGFSATLFAKGQRPLNVGPYFYYSATTMANKGLYNKKHFNFIGLKTEILFLRK